MTASRRRAVFLDRDGVLNRAIVRGGKPYPPASLAELEIIAGAPEATSRLRRENFLLVVVTNQPDIARATQSASVVEAMHSHLRSALGIDAFYVCAHDDHDGCLCRKPAPGLLLKATEDLKIDLQESFLVGDRWRDIEAAHNAGCRSVFIDYNYSEKRPTAPSFIAQSLTQAVDWILANSLSPASSRGASAPTTRETK